MTARRAASAILLAGTAVMLALNAPGQLSYDSVAQLADGRSGFYNSWHPPVMAWLLGVFDALVPGTLLFLIFQSLLLLGALLALLWLKPRDWRAVAIAAAIMLTPQWLLFQGQIWKDVLCANAAIAGFTALAVAAHNGRMRWLLLSALLLGLAAAVRQNAIVLLPVAAAVAALIAPRRGWIVGLCFLAATIGLSTGANLALMARADGGDGASAQIRLGQAYDLVGALAHDATLTLPSLAAEDPSFEKLLRNRAPTLYSPLHNDPFAADPQISQGLAGAPDGAIGRAWRGLVTGHPLLYLHTRLAAFGAVLATPDSSVCHFSHAGIDGPPALLRQLGLTARIRPQDWALTDYAKLFFATPVYSHLAWGLLALVLLALLLRRREKGDLAIAGLLVGALLFTLTFAFVSIACDYRYLLLLDLAAMTAALHLAAPKKPDSF